MVASEFLDYLSKFQVATYVGVEDFADKFNFLITVMILLLCTTVVAVKQYMMKPIACYMATDIGGKNLLDYLENYCWVQGTIPIKFAERIPESEEGWSEAEKHKLLYYQWVPFVLGLQCILFYVPRVIWQMICYNRTGTDIQHLVFSANQAVHSTDEQRGKLIKHVARTLEQLLFQKKTYQSLLRGPYTQSRSVPSSEISSARPTELNLFNYEQHKGAAKVVPDSNCNRDSCTCSRCWYQCCRSSSCSATYGHHRGAYLSLAYLLIKLLYLINAVGQLMIMQRFLGFDEKSIMFGVILIHNIWLGRDLDPTLIFPRVTYCNVPFKNLGTKVNTITAQCVLPVNMLNEKIYIFLWWWVLIVATVTALSLVRWVLRLLIRTNGTEFVYKYLTLTGSPLSPDFGLLKQFARNYLRRDGVFLLRMIAYNAGDKIMSDILTELWAHYMDLNTPKLIDSTGNSPLTDRADGGWGDVELDQLIVKKLYPSAPITSTSLSPSTSQQSLPVSHKHRVDRNLPPPNFSASKHIHDQVPLFGHESHKQEDKLAGSSLV